MNKKNFEKIVKLYSFWKIDKRKGDYKLPSGQWLHNYVEELAEKLLLDNGISKDGNIYFYDKKNHYLIVPFGENEQTSETVQEYRLKKFVRELIG